ncbi:MAG: hypothetical protein KDC84_10770 [Crocinitomicaceae bacterium]|nr:hypothetical protein [Crocinitomicaceae bacterium]
MKIEKCTIPWSEIKDKKTHNLCEHCQICIPDLSNLSYDQAQQKSEMYSCAQVHERHLEDTEGEYHFINKLERKLVKLGFIRFTAILVFLYLFVASCGNNRKFRGKFVIDSDNENKIEVKSPFDKWGD